MYFLSLVVDLLVCIGALAGADELRTGSTRTDAIKNQEAIKRATKIEV